MNTEFGLKELYDLTLKATYPIEMGGRKFEPGEVIARFDKIQLANFKEITSRVSANGGFDNRAHVIWEDPKEIQLNFTQGIFSKRHFIGESDEEGRISVGKQNIRNVFVYNAKTFEKINPKTIDLGKGEVVIEPSYCDVEVDFYYCYQNPISSVVIGQKLIQGYLLLEGKSRVKDDITGKTHTAILRIPRLKLVSDLSMRLGREANPVLANFSAVGLPIGGKGSKQIMELLFLSDDIDAEI